VLLRQLIVPPASIVAQGHATARGAARFAGMERLAVERRAGLAGLDAGGARHHAGIEGLAAEHATGNGPGAAAPHVEGRGTSAASSGSRGSASPLMLAPFATAAAFRVSRWSARAACGA
jgi:hypothetical protein